MDGLNNKVHVFSSSLLSSSLLKLVQLQVITEQSLLTHSVLHYGEVVIWWTSQLKLKKKTCLNKLYYLTRPNCCFIYSLSLVHIYIIILPNEIFFFTTIYPVIHDSLLSL